MQAAIPFLLTIEFERPELLRLATRVQLVARKYGFKPTWLLGVESLKHPAWLEHPARWQRDGDAEVGALLVAAQVPPLVDLGRSDPVPLVDFPESVMDEKLAWMTQALAGSLTSRPTAIRTVPPATDDRYYAALAKHGYKVDLTVVPHARIGGSDFTAYSEKVYFTPQGVLEVPRSVRKRERGFWQTLLGVPSLRTFRLHRGNFGQARTLAGDAVRGGADHLVLDIAAADWSRGAALERDLERVLVQVQTEVIPLTAEEFLNRYKTEQLRKGLL